MSPFAAFFFPDSPGLRERWWHRGVLVAYTAWIATLLWRFFKVGVIDAHTSCTSIKYSEYSTGELDCGPDMFSYAFQNMVETGWADAAITTVLVIILLYLAILIPALAYRTILYIATGGKWKSLTTNSAANHD